MKGDQFSVYCKCFCPLCVTWMVCLRLKGILVSFLFNWKNFANSFSTELGSLVHVLPCMELVKLMIYLIFFFTFTGSNVSRIL